MTTTKILTILGVAGWAGLFNAFCQAADASKPAELTITDTVLRPAEKVPPLGVVKLGNSGSVEWAANNFVGNSGNEPIYAKRLLRVKRCGDNWFEDEVGTSFWGLFGSGFLSGAEVRIYRLVDKEGNPLPETPKYLDISKADHVLFVGKGRIIPDDSPNFPDGGWVATKYADVHPYKMLPPTTDTCTDMSGVINGRTYWYTVVAVGPANTESDPSNEASAAAKAGAPRPANEVVKPGKTPGGAKPAEKPQPPTDLKAEAGDGCVKLTWEPSTSANVLGYRLKRSTALAAGQQQRIYLEPGAPKLLPWDYVALERKFDHFDMKYVGSNVRGMSNPMDSPDWSGWRLANPDGVSFSMVPHPQPVPKEMVDPGDTCLRLDVKEGEQSIKQLVFVGIKQEGNNLWYGQLEPGKHYRAEIWMRQEGLGNGGAVKFSYSAGYPDIKTDWNVTDKWQKFTYAFDAPQRPEAASVFGHMLSFTGPGKLWFDNFRIFRCDKPEDADKPYVPNATVLDELIKSQPATGRKGMHRLWFLGRDANMSSILSWHANSNVSPNPSTSVGSTMNMTLPMGLTFDLATGDSPATRMRPWLVIQHILHSEQEWKNLIEYLAAPYDPKKDSPQEKPWAYLRTQQRGGVLTPWTDEFSNIIIEFGNETWHNGMHEDWLGFSKHNAIWGGGPEYGLFAKYLIENMQSSPYWKSQNLDKKIQFDLGAGYPIAINGDKVKGYGEEAMMTCPQATFLGHANYVGPKWETGQKAFESLDDHGFQATMLGFLAGPEQDQIKQGQARDILERTHHAYDLAAYEGGPSGYPIPTMGRGTVEQAKIAEVYGKSLAMAVASLDCWMRSYEYGWTDQAFSAYAQGKMWASHTTLWDGFRAIPGWQALVMRNRFASGDLMKVEEKNLPTIAWDKKDYPAVGAYAMRDGKQWSVFVLSRSLAQPIPVTLNLPFQTAGKITLHTLAGDPRDTNIDQEKVTIQSKDLPAAALKGGKLTIDPMPPGCVYLYVFDQTSK